jgi:hypothetical protein
MIGEALGGFQVADIFHATGGEVIQQDDRVTTVKKLFRQMRADETGPAGD